MTVRVRAATTGEDLEAWITFPRRFVYGTRSPWVPPLDGDLRRMLDRRKNPFFRHGTALPLLATDGTGRPLGRILAHVYHRHNVRHGERAAFFGYFECRGDPGAAQALVAAAAELGAQHGCTILRGPFNMTAMQEMGILVEGFDAAPAVDETYTAPYYPALLRGIGLQATFPHATYRVDDVAGLDAAALLDERHRTLLRSGRLRVRPADLTHFDREIETLRELLNDSFYANPYFVPITADEFRFQIGPYRRLLDPAINLVAELDGVPCGFVVAAPDFNPLLKRLDGRLGPRGLATFLLGRRHVRGAVIIIMGVQRQLQGAGIMRVLHAELVRALQRRGYRRLTITWIAEVNERSRATVERLGAHPFHRLTLYEGHIPDTHDTVIDGEG
jgi:GNAT superfamily N-acetyltransferase